MERKLFLGSNTPDGFIGYFDKVITMYGLKKLYILKGGSGLGKSTFIQKFAEFFKAQNPERNITYVYCSADPKSLDGAIIEDIGVGIIDGTFPHITDPKFPGMVDQIVDLGKYIDPTKIKVSREELEKLQDEKSSHFKTAYQHLNNARKVHMKIESVYKGAVDFDSINELISKVCHEAI